MIRITILLSLILASCGLQKKSNDTNNQDANLADITLEQDAVLTKIAADESKVKELPKMNFRVAIKTNKESEKDDACKMNMTSTVLTGGKLPNKKVRIGCTYEGQLLISLVDKSDKETKQIISTKDDFQKFFVDKEKVKNGSFPLIFTICLNKDAQDERGLFKKQLQTCTNVQVNPKAAGEVDVNIDVQFPESNKAGRKILLGSSTDPKVQSKMVNLTEVKDYVTFARGLKTMQKAGGIDLYSYVRFSGYLFFKEKISGGASYLDFVSQVCSNSNPTELDCQDKIHAISYTKSAILDPALLSIPKGAWVTVEGIVVGYYVGAIDEKPVSWAIEATSIMY